MKRKKTPSGQGNRPDALFATAMAQHRAGNVEAAASLYGEILRLSPRHANALHFLGLAHRQRGNPAEAARLMAAAIDADPSVPAYSGNFASLCLELGWADKARDCYRRLTLIDADNPLPFFELGRLALREQRRAEAAAALEAAGRRAATAPEMLQAIAELQHEAGFLDAALASFSQLRRIDPRNAHALNHLGGVLAALGRNSEAMDCYRQSIGLMPDLLAARNNLGLALTASDQYELAEHCFRDAIGIDPRYVRAWSNLGITQKNGGQLDAAIASFRAAIGIDPGYAKAYHNLLFTLNNSDSITADELAAEHREFGRRFDSAGIAIPLRPAPEPARKLRIGYVSGDLRLHPVGFFIESIFAHHDSRHSEIHCYSNAVADDALSAVLKQQAAGWVDCAQMSDEALAERIRADAIDILVDLAGHTEHNRLTVFALRPAPIQVTYLGYANTTGMSSIDYRISDALADPPGSEHLGSERLLRLPHSYYCYRPRAEAPDIAPLPALSTGFVTFGSCLNYAKASPTSHALWADVLQAVEGSRLLLRASGFSDAGTRDRAVERFARIGIDPSRIELLPHAPFPSHLDTYARIDIGLDTFPFNLATNAVEALWQGVPIVSLAGDTSPSRMGLSILTAAGLPELAVTTPAAFVATAIRLAGDLPALAAMRATMRARLSRSPLLDGAAKARDLDAAYRTMWSEYCRRAA